MARESSVRKRRRCLGGASRPDVNTVTAEDFRLGLLRQVVAGELPLPLGEGWGEGLAELTEKKKTLLLSFFGPPG